MKLAAAIADLQAVPREEPLSARGIARALKVTLSAVALALTSVTPISALALDAAAQAIGDGKAMREGGGSASANVEAVRLIQEAERVKARLTEISIEDVELDALGRFGDLLAAAKGLNMRWVGPVAHAFRSDKSAISIIMGPYGSAKTTTCFQKIINSLIWQPPGPDGVKRARWCVVRDTIGHLEANVMADWFLWMPKTKANYNDTKKVHVLRMDIPMAGGKVERLELELMFRAVENHSAEELFKGMALTGLWLNEMDTLHRDVFKFGFPRVGRYRHPGTPLGGWSGVIGDMNAPAEDNWTYDFAVNKNIGLSPEEMAAYQAEFGDSFRVTFHRQPGAMEAGAENRDNLPNGYYERMQIGMSEADKRRFIHNNFGAVRDGQPVYSSYNDERHCVAELKADKRFAVYLGVDGGNTPSVVFGQKDENRQVRIVDEVVVFKPGTKDVLEKLGGKEFGQEVGRYWNDNFEGFRLGEFGWGDPSAWFGDSDKNAEDRAWIVKFVSGFNETAIGVKLKMKPAPVKRNLINPRLDAVRDAMKDVDGKPGYIVSDRCKKLREGFNRGYVITRVQFSTGGGRWKDEPLKNDFSHVHDANQYLVLGLTKFDGWEDAEGEQRGRERRAKRRGQVNYGSGHFARRAGAGRSLLWPANDNTRWERVA